MATKIRLTASPALPSGRYVNGPVEVTSAGWTEHELDAEVLSILVEFSRNRILIHLDDAKALEAVGYKLVDNEVVELDSKEGRREEAPRRGRSTR